MKIPYTPARWAIDDNPAIGSPDWAEKQGRRLPDHQHVPGTRPPHRRPRPASPEAAPAPPRARPAQLRAHHLGSRPRVRHRWPGRARGDEAGRRPVPPTRCLLPHRRHRVHAHPGAGAESMDPGAGRGAPLGAPREERLRTLRKLNQAEAFERFLHTKYVGHKRFGLEGAESASSRCSTSCSTPPPRTGWRRSSSGWPTAAGSTSSPTSSGRATAGSSASSRVLSPETIQGSGDVKYHLGAKGNHDRPRGPRAVGAGGGQPEPPRGGGPGARGSGQGQAGVARSQRAPRGPPRPDPRRRRLRRPGGGGGDAQPLAASRAIAPAGRCTS